MVYTNNLWQTWGLWILLLYYIIFVWDYDNLEVWEAV